MGFLLFFDGVELALTAFSMFFTVLSMLLVKPHLIYDISFQLSYTSTAGLMYIARDLRLQVSERQTIPRWVMYPAAMTISAQLASLPIVIWYFNKVSLGGDKMPSYYDNLNAFHKVNELEPLPASAQLVMLHLLHKNNCFGNVGQFQMTDTELQRITRLSKVTITESKRLLKNRGFIDFKTDKKNPRKGTYYNIIDYGKVYANKYGKKPANPRDLYYRSNLMYNKEEDKDRAHTQRKVEYNEHNGKLDTNELSDLDKQLEQLGYH